MSEHIDIDHELITIRHYLHAHPERSFREFGTSIYLTDQLKAHGIEILHNPLETGVVGLIQGEAGPGPRIGLRADIDGLPIVEDSGLEFSSVNEGVMHGCGHDLHMTGLLGAAFWLAEHRDKFAGSIKILFQPSEETGQGARAMIDAGLVDDVEAIIGTHNNPNYAPGQLAIGVEPMMAGCVKFRVTLHAQGTHAGYPYKGTGPIEALASIILSLQTIVSRNVTPFHPLVLSVTEVHGGHVWNVVPAEAGFKGLCAISTSRMAIWSAADSRKWWNTPPRHTASAPTWSGMTFKTRWSPIQVSPRPWRRMSTTTRSSNRYVSRWRGGLLRIRQGDVAGVRVRRVKR